MPTKSPAQLHALALLRTAGGYLDYQPTVFGFAQHGAARVDRVQMVTAQALIRAGLVIASRTRLLRGRAVPDRLELVDAEAFPSN
jgi:hypothetical protein